MVPMHRFPSSNGCTRDLSGGWDDPVIHMATDNGRTTPMGVSLQ